MDARGTAPMNSPREKGCDSNRWTKVITEDYIEQVKDGEFIKMGRLYSPDLFKKICLFDGTEVLLNDYYETYGNCFVAH